MRRKKGAEASPSRCILLRSSEEAEQVVSHRSVLDTEASVSVFVSRFSADQVCH